ncbi:MAG: methionyl-tRNA formyltransferase [Chloroflexi bacterium]|nr:methionyl-tRNA formyltransferase [Chloroflexota bacterium]|tara:strand:+ start:6256 stop:6918 length:663 start_codon:yes stop_codon:yes gene_type:complete
MNYVYCAHREYSLNVFKKLKKKYKNFILIKDKENLTISKIQNIDPKFIFFPDWSWILPNEIIKNYQCVCIHESNLPKFRGGSPLQNQIIRGIKKTKSTAFLMNEKIDAGKILLKKELSLDGTLDEIFLRMENNNYDLITKIIQGKYKLTSQKGIPSFFNRRKPSQSELKNLNHSKLYLHNFIRMLSDPYPNAFIKIGKKKIIFKSSKLDGKKLSFEGEIE